MTNFEALHNTQPGPEADPGAAPTADQLRRTERVGGWCLISLASLFIVAELSAPGPLVLIAALVYSFSALAWTVLLYRQWSAGGIALPPLPAIWSAMGLGGLAVILGLGFETWTTLGRPGIQVAAITRRAEGYFIVHVDSGKSDDFPLVNGAPIGAQATRLNDNDVIQLAGVKMGFFVN